jgi:hypothetical protein
VGGGLGFGFRLWFGVNDFGLEFEVDGIGFRVCEWGFVCGLGFRF